MYGKEAMGLDKTSLSSLRTMAAEAVSGPSKGKCTTTCIWLGLGSKYDPAIKATIDQVNMWLDIAPKFDQVRMARAWWVQG